MDNTSHEKAALDKIDTEMFFGLIAEKIDKRQLELVTAAMAESVGRGSVSRVLDRAVGPHARIASLRKQLRDKVLPVTTKG